MDELPASAGGAGRASLRFAKAIDDPYLGRMPLLTPTERVTLEAIRDTGIVSGERLAWTMEKGYAEVAGRFRYRLTKAGLEALASDDEQRMDARRQ
jgi:hypothetical protein